MEFTESTENRDWHCRIHFASGWFVQLLLPFKKTKDWTLPKLGKSFFMNRYCFHLLSFNYLWHEGSRLKSNLPFIIVRGLGSLRDSPWPWMNFSNKKSDLVNTDSGYSGQQDCIQEHLQGAAPKCMSLRFIKAEITRLCTPCLPETSRMHTSWHASCLCAIKHTSGSHAVKGR